ncbi:MAG: DUF4868 domain-containing protein [Candidatus Competibacteraceae bacterium]|nr:DUF4868 domain-containing protein [Candidatus Competibacteraceae bacterium]
MSAKRKLTEALEIIEKDAVSVKLYMITRHIKDGIKKTAKVIDTYSFQACTVDLSKDLNEFFVGITKKQIIRMVKDDYYEVEKYAVIGDDLENKIYTYALNNALSFSDVIINQMLKGNCPNIASLSEIKNDLWAYSIRFNHGDKTVYTFRKASKGKVATDEPRTKLERISALFDTDDAELKVAIKETISFDDKLDCLYSNEEFLILRKKGFEQIVGLEEEFAEVAASVIGTIAKTELVEGIELLEAAIKEKRSLLKTLSNIGKKGTHNTFDSNEINKMKEALYAIEGRELKLSVDGKLVLENADDVICFVKLLNDYYKQGVVSGKYYGTNSGQIIAPVDNNA